MDVSKYAALFLAESREHLTSCNQLLLDWERDPSAVQPVGGLFRAIHTIKGMAATMGYGGVASLAHATENLLDAVRGGRAAVTPDLIQLLFAAVDALTAAVGRAGRGEDAAGEGDSELVAALEREAGSATVGVPAAGRDPGAHGARARVVSVVIRPAHRRRGIGIRWR